ncbi:efflux RND transporter permease subunit, partial [Escherichia coli]|nr:efflux RND transporter permease subunit [Escherichia coli]
RKDADAIGRLPIITNEGSYIPLSSVASIAKVTGPAMISSENGLLRGTVLLNVRGRDVVGFVNEAKQAVQEKVQLPAGYYISWSGQF